MEWLLKLGFQYLLWFSVPYLYRMATDWPWHFGLSAVAGLWAFYWTWITSHVLWQYSSGEAPSRPVVRFIWLRSVLWSICVSVVTHCLRDFYLIILRTFTETIEILF